MPDTVSTRVLYMAHDPGNLSSTGTRRWKEALTWRHQIYLASILSLSVKTPVIALVVISQGLNEQIYLQPWKLSIISLPTWPTLLDKRLSCHEDVSVLHGWHGLYKRILLCLNFCLKLSLWFAIYLIFKKVLWIFLNIELIESHWSSCSW